MRPVDESGDNRTQTHSKKHSTQQETLTPTPPTPRLDDVPEVQPHEEAEDEDHFQDPEKLFDSMKSDLVNVCLQERQQHDMVTLMDVLQTLGISATDACSFASFVVRDQPWAQTLCQSLVAKQECVAALTGHPPSFIEVYGRGSSVDMANNKRRDLNIHGIDALDIRTTKPDGTHWDFNNAADRRLAKEIILSKNPTWLLCSPPCTSFSQLNFGWNV